MIGIFDSGYGGLTVLKPMLELLPQYDYFYLGDSSRAPYGNHSPATIQTYSEQAVNFLFDHGCKLVIFACNSASATALRPIQQKYLSPSTVDSRKILGVLIPAAESALEISKNGQIAIVGTRATINSRALDTEIRKINPQAKVTSMACPLLVPLIEEDWHNKPEAISILKKYLRPLKTHNPDTLILGCTHYPLMQKHFQRIMGRGVRIVNSGLAAADKLQNYLKRHPEIETQLSRSKKRLFATTGSPEVFKKFVEKHFGMKIKVPAKVQLG